MKRLVMQVFYLCLGTIITTGLFVSSNSDIVGAHGVATVEENNSDWPIDIEIHNGNATLRIDRADTRDLALAILDNGKMPNEESLLLENKIHRVDGTTFTFIRVYNGTSSTKYREVEFLLGEDCLKVYVKIYDGGSVEEVYTNHIENILYAYAHENISNFLELHGMGVVVKVIKKE